MDLAARQKEMEAMSDVLADDAHRTLDRLVAEDSPQVRRQLFRDHFAAIEGTAFGMKIMALRGHAINGALLSEAEVALAHEVSFELKQDGTTVSQSARLRFAPNLLFSLRLIAKVMGREWRPPTDDHRWEALLRAAKVRDRLMHPKLLADLTVSDEELMALGQGYDWFWRARGETITGLTPAVPGGFEKLLRLHRRLTAVGD